MMSLQTIAALSAEARSRAAKLRLEPYTIFSRDTLPVDVQHAPFIGSHCPRPWRRVGEALFVDTSGWGSPGEPALTFDQLVAKLTTLHDAQAAKGYVLGVAFIEQGQFQGYLQVYRRKIGDYIARA